TRPEESKKSAHEPLTRRGFMQAAAGLGAAAALGACKAEGDSKAAEPTSSASSSPLTSSAGASSSAPETADLRFGMIALTDCSPIVIAHEKGFFKKYGINSTVVKGA